MLSAGELRFEREQFDHRDADGRIDGSQASVTQSCAVRGWPPEGGGRKKAVSVSITSSLEHGPRAVSSPLALAVSIAQAALLCSLSSLDVKRFQQEMRFQPGDAALR